MLRVIKNMDYMNISFGTCVDTFLLICVEAEPLGHRGSSFQRDGTPAVITTGISMCGGSGCCIQNMVSSVYLCVGYGEVFHFRHFYFLVYIWGESCHMVIFQMEIFCIMPVQFFGLFSIFSLLACRHSFHSEGDTFISYM